VLENLFITHNILRTVHKTRTRTPPDTKDSSNHCHLYHVMPFPLLIYMYSKPIYAPRRGHGMTAARGQGRWRPGSTWPLR
jgi:hypothetical protein